MIDEITTNKTEFFREHQHFDFLISDVLPSLVTSEWSTLSFWCAGCSTGEEPYSLAMVLAEYFGTTRNFTIFATDLSTQALWTARRAVYPTIRVYRSVRPSAEIFFDGPWFADREIPYRSRITRPRHVRPSQPDRPRLEDTGNHEYSVLPQYHDLLRSENTRRDRRKVWQTPQGQRIPVRRSLQSLGGLERKLGFAQVRPTVYVLRR